MGHTSDRGYKKLPHLAPADWILPQTSLTSVVTHVSDAQDVDDYKTHICMTSVAEVEGINDSSIWIVESACTSQMTFDRSELLTYRQTTSNMRIGTKARATTAGIADIIISTIIN